MLKSPKTKTLTDGLINKKSCIRMEKAIDRGKRSEILSEVNPVENISKNLQSVLEIRPVQKETLPSHKL